MKKIIIFVVITMTAFFLFPMPASANFPPGINCSSPGANAYPIYYQICLDGSGQSWTPPSSGVNFVNAMYYYVLFKDEYRVDYLPPSGVSWYQLHFTSPTNVVYTGDYNFQPTGTHWLTCNGTYKLKFFDAANNLIYETQEMVTSQIQQPSCSSYSDGISGNDDLGGSYTPNGDGSYTVSWNATPGASSYEVWTNGQLTDVTTGTSSQVTDKGSVSIIAKDGSGNIIGQTDMQVPDLQQDYQDNTGGGGCNVCDKIAAALECPEWDTYMGELTGAIRAALPTLPEWREIADQFVDAFAEYFGDVPAAPTAAEIDNAIRPDLPNLDMDVPGSDMLPVMPDEFDEPFVFDITDAPEIEIVDDSEPFEIYEPDEFIDSDAPGTFVYPGDSRNSSGGIKSPDTIITPYPEPVPTMTPDPGESPEIPPSEMPIPSGSTGTTPIPTKPGGDMAFPIDPTGEGGTSP